MARIGIVGGGNNVVWGTERPELLITETLAWHDRRTEGLETPTRKRLTISSQTKVTTNVSARSSVLRRASQPVCQGGRRSRPGGAPVWRLAVAKVDPNGSKPGADPDDPDPAECERQSESVALDGRRAGLVNNQIRGHKKATVIRRGADTVAEDAADKLLTQLPESLENGERAAGD